MNREDLEKLNRKDLQAVAKENGLKANKKSENLIEELLAIFQTNGSNSMSLDVDVTTKTNNTFETNQSKAVEKEQGSETFQIPTTVDVVSSNNIVTLEPNTIENIVQDTTSADRVVGATIYFLHNNEDYCGIVKRINKKTVRVVLNDGSELSISNENIKESQKPDHSILEIVSKAISIQQSEKMAPLSSQEEVGDVKFTPNDVKDESRDEDLNEDVVKEDTAIDISFDGNTNEYLDHGVAETEEVEEGGDDQVEEEEGEGEGEEDEMEVYEVEVPLSCYTNTATTTKEISSTPLATNATKEQEKEYISPEEVTASHSHTESRGQLFPSTPGSQLKSKRISVIPRSTKAQRIRAEAISWKKDVFESAKKEQKQQQQQQQMQLLQSASKASVSVSVVKKVFSVFPAGQPKVSTSVVCDLTASAKQVANNVVIEKPKDAVKPFVTYPDKPIAVASALVATKPTSGSQIYSKKSVGGDKPASKSFKAQSGRVKKVNGMSSSSIAVSSVSSVVTKDKREVGYVNAFKAKKVPNFKQMHEVFQKTQKDLTQFTKKDEAIEKNLDQQMAAVLTVPVQKTVSSSLLQGATPLPSSIGSSSQVKTQRTSNIPTSVQNRSGTNTHISSSNNMKRVPFGRIAESDTPIKPSQLAWQKTFVTSRGQSIQSTQSTKPTASIGGNCKENEINYNNNNNNNINVIKVAPKITDARDSSFSKQVQPVGITEAKGLCSAQKIKERHQKFVSASKKKRVNSIAALRQMHAGDQKAIEAPR